MRKLYDVIVFLLLIGIAVEAWVLAHEHQARSHEYKIAQLKKKVNHIIIIYQENWSFDGLYGKFPGANGIDSAPGVLQSDTNGNVLTSVRQPFSDVYHSPYSNDIHFPDSLPPVPYDLLKYIGVNSQTGDITHRFYHEQLQIGGGKMDKFIAWSENPGLVMSYFDASNLPEGKLAQQYTMCDNFFHSAFGGSFLNHIWLIAAATPEWYGKPTPESMLSKANPHLDGFDNVLDVEGKHVINTAYSVNHPHDPKKADSLLVPGQKMLTIGDRLTDAGLGWAWYSGGWDDALQGKPDSLFQYHHQPFVYFERYKDGSKEKAEHLKDETDFFKTVKEGTLPQVSFIKPLGEDNEHPGYTNLKRGQQHVDSIVQLIKNSKYWDDAVIIITYDENGGRWDHVAPPKIDKWGPGSRVPTIVISPYAKKKFVDHTEYETVSILKLIETRFGLKPLNTRDAEAHDLLNTLDFK